MWFNVNQMPIEESSSNVTVKLDQKIETVFLMSEIENEIISSKFIKEIAHLKGDLKKFVSKSVIRAINEKLK